MAKKKNKQKENLPVYNRRTLNKIILSILGESPSESFNYKQIAKMLEITDNQLKQLIVDVFYDLKEEAKVDEVYTGKFRFSAKSSQITGIVDMTKNGAAYIVTPESKEDVYVARENLNRALHGDTVLVNLWARRKNRQPEGEVLEILQRAKTNFVGILQVSKNHAFLETSDRHMPYDIFVPISQLNGAENGQKVVVQLTEWESTAKNPTGKVLDILGKPGENNTEMHAILAEFNLPYRFPENLNVIAQTIEPGITPEEIGRRRDFRNITTFTIDPHDAKDFDDALSYRVLDNGNIEVGIHIADVTHYVKPDSEIDKEAMERGTSVYLVDRTVPMLPERLSNFICSLRPNEEKLTYSAVFELDENASVKHSWFGRTVINSNRRFTYEEAQIIIETGEGDLNVELLKLNDLAKKLRDKRFVKGAISFDRVEVKFNIDETGKPLSVYFKEAKDSNKLIEEFMLLANKKVAEFVGRRAGGTPKTFVYRVHDEPDMQKLYDFSNFIKRFGYKIKFDNEKEIATSLNFLLKEVKGKVESNVIEQLAVRSMAKAEYSVNNIGHYGLAFEHYTHFTSPIRRYPDMMVHRLLDLYLKNGSSVSAETYEAKCKKNSASENQSAQAERASIKYKQVEFMLDKLGSFFQAVITGVTEHGIYAEIQENKIEGMIPMRDMDDDFYVYDEKNYCITGQRNKRTFQLGDIIKIQIIRANMQKRQLDFMLADSDGTKTGEKTSFKKDFSKKDRLEHSTKNKFSPHFKDKKKDKKKKR